MWRNDGARGALAIIIGLTLWRVGFLALNGTDLFVDEAQYWLWGQNLDFGYYSKPPMIGWLIRAVTDLAGSDAPFWVRLPAPVLHMITALLVMKVAAELYGKSIANWAGPVYIALPFVTVGSALISTDTVMLPFFALALLMYVRLLRAPSGWHALIMGLALGLALMSKYAGIYFVLGAGLAAALQPGARLTLRDSAIAGVAAVAAFGPNIWWNMAHGATTVRHTAALAGWNAGTLHFDRALEFAASQFAVFGPVLFGALLWLSARALTGRLRGVGLTLWLFSAPVIGLMVVQGLLNKAYANWAVAAYIAATILVVKALQTRPKLLYATQALHLSFALLVPLLMAVPGAIRLPGGDQLFARYLGLADVSRAVQSEAAAEGLSVVIAQNRNLLADLHYTLRDANLRLYALPRAGFAASYYEQKFPLPGMLSQSALYVTTNARPPCPEAHISKRWAPQSGAYAGKTLTIFRLSAQCLREIGGK